VQTIAEGRWIDLHSNHLRAISLALPFRVFFVFKQKIQAKRRDTCACFHHQDAWPGCIQNAIRKQRYSSLAMQNQANHREDTMERAVNFGEIALFLHLCELMMSMPENL
jgi:hypothetical protein